MQQRAPGERAASRTRPDFVSAVRALDRVLISGSYVVPLFYLPQQSVARRLPDANLAVRLSPRDLVARTQSRRCSDRYQRQATASLTRNQHYKADIS
jgi:hypothetical protein